MTNLSKMLRERSDGSRSVLIMGILNVTPDSFYDGGEYDSTRLATKRARVMFEEGADVIDVGGESTRPGADPVSVAEEKERVIPVVQSITEELPVPVSVDTSKAEVAREALNNGADMINDVTGLEDPELLEVVAEYGCPVCVMHMQGTPETMQDNPRYDSVLEDVREYLSGRVEAAVQAGLDPETILVDPGIGFGKTLEHNRQLLANVRGLKQIGNPVMIGHSRKSFIGEVLGNSTNDRLTGTLSVSGHLLRQDVDVLRVHDVAEHVEAREIHQWLEGS